MRKKILIIDDDEDFKIVVTKYLSNFGYEIITAKDGLNGIFKASSNELSPDLIILDINMAELDGIETYKFLKENPKLKNIPVIFVSGAVEYSEVVKNIKMNKNNITFLQKPVALGELVKKAEELLTKKNNV
ncbi:MAG TPA: response regulator [bacterium]|mgnify:CR=1 FL=1|nr:response regulator [bacterium]HPN32388.1 response regulator [bacterium]